MAASAQIRPIAAPLERGAVRAAFFAVVAVGCLGISVRLSAPTFVQGVAVIGFLAAAVWMCMSERHALTLTVLALYLGLADGYLKLSTGVAEATLARDVLLYAMCFGMLARALMRNDRLRLPPYGGLLLAYVAVVVVEVLNPGSDGLGRSLASLRPHLEFVPLFFLGYLVVRSQARLRGFLVVLVVVGAANGVVSYVQFTLTPDQVAAWGPGYAERIEGTQQVGARTFEDSAGQTRVRPFGLAADSGQGGFVGLLALPAVLALVSLARSRARWLALLLGFAVALAIITSQGRTVIIASFVVVMTYTVLTIVGRRLVPTLAAIAALGLVLYAATSFSSDSAGSAAFSRLETIAPSSVLTTAQADRGSAFTALPGYVVHFPFGAGLGSVGPAAAFDRARAGELNGETEFNYLVVELGVLGGGLLLWLFAAVIARTFRSLRAVPDASLRSLLAALAAPLVGMVVMFFATTPTSGSPGAPYFFTASGVLAYWLKHAYGRRAPRKDRPRAGVA